MKPLKRKIKRLDAKMNADKIATEQDLVLLKRFLKNPVFLAGTLIAGVSAGYLVARKTGVKQLLRFLVATPFFVVRTVRNAQLVSWLIK